MLKLRKKLLAGLLTASMVFSLGQGVVWSEAEDAAAADTAAEDTGADAESGDDEEEVPVTEDEAFAEMVLYAENTKLALYVNEVTTVFAVKNKANGYIWWSTPFDVDTDPIAKGAQIKTMRSLFYFDAGDPSTHNSSKTTAYEGAVSKKNFKVAAVDNGVKFTLTFMKTDLKVCVYVTLNEDSFDVRIPGDEIVENLSESTESNYELLTLSLLSSLGSGSSTEDGFIFLPDGSGAIVKFNNGKTSTAIYKSQVYGSDASVSTTEAPAKTEQVYLPIFGVVKDGAEEDNGLLAVVTEGDSYAYINANVSGQNTTSYNSAWFSFQMRATDTFKIGSKEPQPVYEGDGLKINDINVRYYVLNAEDVTVTDLADTYRNYLINEKGLAAKSTDDANSLFLTFNGGTVKTQSVLGFPIDLQTIATSYSEALEIVKELNAAGVDDITIDYKDYSDAGMTGKITSAVDYSNKLGGKSEFTELMNYISTNGMSLYPSVDFMEYSNSGKGYSFTLNSCIRITKAYATQDAYFLNYGIANPYRSSWSLLSPYYIPDVFNKLIASFKAEGINTISLEQATTKLYSDFSRHNADGRSYFVREDTQNILIDGYKALNDAGITILADACNAYALPYVSAITNVPLYSSNFDMFDYDVPFYQMLIHGYIPYSSKPVNASANEDELLLLSLLTGSGLHYDIMYSSPNEFIDSEYDNLYYTYYKGWMEDIAVNYALFNETVSSVSGKTITGYERKSATEFEMTYSDGTVIAVDTDSLDFSVNGKAYNLADYELKGESK